MRRPKNSTSNRTGSDGPVWLRFPPVVGPDGRMAGHADPRAAVAQLVLLAGDVAHGECPDLPTLTDPCPPGGESTPADRLRQAARAVKRLLVGLGRAGVGVTVQPGEGPEVGRLAVRCSGWSEPLLLRLVARDPERFRLEPVEEVSLEHVRSDRPGRTAARPCGRRLPPDP
jgi:hypothetical protein